MNVRRGHGLFALAISLFLACALFSTAAWSQTISGDIVGTVVDKSGAGIPNATVTATHVTTNVSSTTKTNTNGGYRFTNLPVGTYNITAAASGFATTTLKGFDLELNKTATARVVMDIAKVATTVEVTENALPAIDTSTAQLQTTYDARELQDLPGAAIGQYGVLNLSLLQAGVSSAGNVGAGIGPSVGGQRPRNNNFTIEGIDNNDKGVTGPLVYVPNEAVSNFSVLQNQYSPEFGHSTGGQFNQVVTSGTNTFHGRVYEYFQNRNLNAVDQAQVNSIGLTSNLPYDNNRFGGQLGGPIVKNKLFFFANFEYNPQGFTTFPSSAILAPTSAGYALLNSATGISQQNVSIFHTYAVAPGPCTSADISSGTCPTGGVLPVSTGAGTVNVPVGILPPFSKAFYNRKALITSGDYVLSDKDQFRLRYIYNKVDQTDFAANLPFFYTTIAQPYHLVNLSEFHTFTPSITNEFRVGFNRTELNFPVPNLKAPGQDAFPNITVDELGLNLGPDPNAPQFSIQNTYQIVDNLSWTKGNHSLKFGGEYRWWISPQLFIQRSRGDYEWSTFSDYLNDVLPDFAERSFGSVGYSGNQKAFYWYANDTWKVRPSFSLNLGLRYEYTGVPFGWTQQALNSIASVPGLIEFNSPKAPKTDFMPRVGFAWAPGNSANTSVRGGFGMGYDILYDNIGTLARPPQIGSTIDCAITGGTCVAPSGFLAHGGIPLSAGGGLTGITTFTDPVEARSLTASFLPNEVKYPYSMQWNLGVQHVFATNYTAEVRYVGTRGVHLNVQDRLDIISRVSPTRFLPTFIGNAPASGSAQANGLPLTLADLRSTPNILPAFAAAGFDPGTPIVGFLPLGGSTYHGLQTQLNRRFANGLQFQAAWTWSHNIDDSTADFFSTVLTPRRPEDFQNLKADRGNSALDRRHRFSFAVVYDLPFFKHSNSFLKNVVGNWELTPTYIYETGEWADIQSGVDANLNGDNAGDRAIFNPGGIKNAGSGVKAITNSAGATVGYGALKPGSTSVFCTSAADCGQYIVAGAGALSNMGRNTFRMNPINNVDLGLAKRINFTERVRFELGAQAGNLLNHPQFLAVFPSSVAQPSSNVLTSTTTRNFLIPNKQNFLNPKATFPSNPRIMQLFAKFSF